MTALLIDTTVLIDSLRGSHQSDHFLIGSRGKFRLLVHPVVEAELIAAARNRGELHRVMQCLERFENAALDLTDARLSLRLLARHRLSDRMSWQDCLLAATAIRMDIPLATSNDKHFRVFRGLVVVRPY